MAHCYALASGKGGVGKSTIAANIAAALASKGRRVVMIDADIGLRSLDVLLSMENKVVYDILDLIGGDCLPEQALIQSETLPGLFLLPAAQFARAKSLDPRALRKIIMSLRYGYDDIVIDCPAGIERGLRNVLNAGVDQMIIVVTPDDLTVRSAERACQVIEGKQLSRPLLIVNRLCPELIRCGEMMSARTVSEIMDLPLLGEIPEDSMVYRSMLRHSMLMDFDCEARNAVVRVVNRLQGTAVPFPAYGSERGSFFRRFFKVKPKEVIPIDNH